MLKVLAAIAALLLFAAPSGAQSPRQGVDNARRAGIAVDPRAALLMAEAPAGSCANDPTLPTCPPAHAVVYRGAMVAPSLAAPRSDPLAAMAIDQCRVRVTVQSPYKAVGLAQMDAQNVCSIAVTTHELYGLLRSFKRGKWWAIAGRLQAHGAPGKRISVHVRYKCRRARLRAWEAHADAWSLLRGVWYAGSQVRYNNLRCV
jgi:hypothetical protein